MNPVQVLFQFEEGGYPPIIIQCNSDMKMNAVIDSFKNKVNADGINIEFNDYSFYFNDNIINLDSKLSRFQLRSSSSSRTLIILSVRKRSKLTKCPDCEGNTCFLKIENYGLIYYGCPHNHELVKTFAQYEDSQKINYGQIKCDKCSKTRKEVKEMYKCLTCSKKFQRSCYFCNECDAIFAKDNSGVKHKTIKYDDKNYICLDGCDYLSFCSTCKKDLCEICEKSHKNKKHDIVKYDSITPKIKAIKRELEEIKGKIAESKSHIKQILKMIEDASSTLDKYYIICMDIVGKYESYNTRLRNFHIINNINFIEKSNKIVMENLNDLLKGENFKKDYLNKCDILFDIFYKERGNYTGSNTKDNNNPPKIEVHVQKEKNFGGEDSKKGRTNK